MKALVSKGLLLWPERLKREPLYANRMKSGNNASLTKVADCCSCTEHRTSVWASLSIVHIVSPLLDQNSVVCLKCMQHLICATIIPRGLYYKIWFGVLAGRHYQCWRWADMLEQLPVWGTECSHKGWKQRFYQSNKYLSCQLITCHL